MSKGSGTTRASSSSSPKGLTSGMGGKKISIKKAKFIASANAESDLPLKVTKERGFYAETEAKIGNRTYRAQISSGSKIGNYYVYIEEDFGNWYGDRHSIHISTLKNLSKQIKYEMKPSWKTTSRLGPDGEIHYGSSKVTNKKLEQEKLS